MNGGQRNRRPTVDPDLHQTQYTQLRELLRRFLVADLESSHDSDKIKRVGYGAAAALASLLAAHPVDRRGRCQLCRGRGWWGNRRVCMVFQKTHYWLRQPSDQLPIHLAGELWSAVPLPLRKQPEAQRPDPDHGEAGAHLPRPLLASP